MEETPPLIPLIEKKSFRHKRKIIAGAVFFLCLAAYAFSVLRLVRTAPDDFPTGTRFTIRSGTTLEAIADDLHEARIINSRMWFTLLVTIGSGERSIRAGEYLFGEPTDTIGVIKRLVRGDHGFPLVKITIPEGFSTQEISSLLSSKLDSFDAEEFLRITNGKEGYLFPETYSLAVNAQPQDVVKALSATFEKKTAPLGREVLDSGHSLHEILTMASILEEEAKTPESRRVVSGILWNRIKIGMPLQVDAAFLYINGKNTYELTLEDLAITSPYNTYKVKGLPPTPISNPGFDSIEAALQPTATKYLYYLSERDGTMHYAVTYAEHLRNKARYIP